MGTGKATRRAVLVVGGVALLTGYWKDPTRHAAYPGLVREVAAAGHKIANHTWSHADLVYLPRQSPQGHPRPGRSPVRTANMPGQPLHSARYGL